MSKRKKSEIWYNEFFWIIICMGIKDKKFHKPVRQHTKIMAKWEIILTLFSRFTIGVKINRFLS